MILWYKYLTGHYVMNRNKELVMSALSHCDSFQIYKLDKDIFPRSSSRDTYKIF